MFIIELFVRVGGFRFEGWYWWEDVMDSWGVVEKVVCSIILKMFVDYGWRLWNCGIYDLWMSSIR